MCVCVRERVYVFFFFRFFQENIHRCRARESLTAKKKQNTHSLDCLKFNATIGLKDH